MLGKTNVGGTGKLFAAIGATYPEGSTCTCAGEGKTWTAKTTTGQWVFPVPKAGTYTVSCFDGDDYDSSGSKKSESVTISEAGQLVDVELKYGQPLYTNGTQNVAWQSGSEAGDGDDDYGYVKFNSSSIKILPSSYKQHISTTSTVPLTGYSTLYLEYESTYDNSSGFMFGTTSTSPSSTSTSWTAKKVIADTSGVKTIASVPIGTGSKYIRLQTNYQNNDYAEDKFVIVHRVWLE